MGQKGKQGAGQEAVCIVPNCGRPPYARGLCQTHHRQLMTTGKLKPIRPYRPRKPGTEKFSGLRLSPVCVEQLELKAKRQGLSKGAAIAEILEAWVRSGAGRSRR